MTIGDIGQAADLEEIVFRALAEDVGPGDVTTMATVSAESQAVARILAREPGVFSGLEVVREVIRLSDPSIAIESQWGDGAEFASGDVLFLFRGKARSLLTMERVILNFAQRLSGIATLTRTFVRAVDGTNAAITDTRKTTPGLRPLEKAAVRHGGGMNHRMGLYDAFLIKNNHITASGGITRAVELARASEVKLHLTVEVRTLAEAAEASGQDVDQIMLDNMEPPEIERAVEEIRGTERRTPDRGRRILIEVSGGVTLENVRSRALPGVDLISVGALTHSARALDLAMRLG